MFKICPVLVTHERMWTFQFSLYVNLRLVSTKYTHKLWKVTNMSENMKRMEKQLF